MKKQFSNTFLALPLAMFLFLFFLLALPHEASAADVTIDGTVSAFANTYTQSANAVFTDSQTGYVFFVDSDDRLVYYKTTNGGQSWGSAVPISAVESDVVGFAVWYDGWTPADTGTKIHLLYLEATFVDDVLYRSLDTSGDSLGTERIVFNAASIEPGGHVAIAKSRGGNLYAVGFDDNTSSERFAVKSGNEFASVSTIAAVGFTGSEPVLMFPGNEADPNDMWLIFLDSAADIVYLKTYDDSLDSWGTTEIAANTNPDFFDGDPWMSGAVRHSDGHLIFAILNDFDISTGDIRVWDINGASSITPKTDVVTNSDDIFFSPVFIDQNTDDIYVGYAGKSNGSETIGTSVGVYYKKSTDGGTSWGSEQTYAESLGNVRMLSGSFGGSNTRFMLNWYYPGPADLMTNFINSIEIIAPETPARIIRLRGTVQFLGTVRLR